MYYLIYQITNKINGKIYIGKHITQNKQDDYYGSGILIKRAISEYGLKNFDKQILFECQSEDEMNKKEAELVNESFVHRKDTYNIAIGGEGGWYHCNGELVHNNKHNHRRTGFLQMIDQGINPSREWMKKLSDEEFKEFCLSVSKGLKTYYETHESNWKGRKHKESTKQKMRDYKAEFHPGAGEKNSNYGKHWWKDPNDRTKTKSIKDGDPVPEGWIRGKWQTLSDKGLENIKNGNKQHAGDILINNGKESRFISKDSSIPDGWKRGSIFRKNPDVKRIDWTPERIKDLRLRQVKTKFEKLKAKNYDTIKEQFDFYQTHSWQEFKDKYDYKYTRNNFINQAKRYLKDEWYRKPLTSKNVCDINSPVGNHTESQH